MTIKAQKQKVDWKNNPVREYYPPFILKRAGYDHYAEWELIYTTTNAILASHTGSVMQSVDEVMGIMIKEITE